MHRRPPLDVWRVERRAVLNQHAEHLLAVRAGRVGQRRAMEAVAAIDGEARITEREQLLNQRHAVCVDGQVQQRGLPTDDDK